MESFESKVKALFHTEVTGFYPTGHGGVGEESEVTIPTYNIGKLVDLAREADAALAEVRRAHDLTIGLIADYKVREKQLEGRIDRLTAINTAKGELIEWYSNHVVGAFGSKGIQKHNELRARIRSLENES